QKPASAPAKAAEPLDLPLVADGTVRIGQTVYQGLTIDDFDLQYRLEKNVLTVQRLQGKVANGTFGSTASIDLGRAVPTYTSRFDLKGIQADPLVTAFWPKSAGTVFGTLNLQATVEGKGTDPAVLKQNLNSRGDLVLTDGRFTGGELVQGLAAFLNIEELRNLRFDQAKGNFTIRQGQLLVDSSMTGKEVSLRPKGTIALEGNQLDLALNLRVAPSISKRLDRGRFTQLFADPQGWTQLPVKVAGTIDAPRFSLDTAALGEQVKEKAGEEIRQRLQKEIDRRFPTGTSEPADPEAPPAKKPPVEEMIRGLFR
ncbi:MAG: AsmA-like C-terminal region-containing protein, partial [Desulfuromonadales bacterium]|nr:AsmA-like C-terminal region-containing protein [Desulfuromonadales bacterium]